MSSDVLSYALFMSHILRHSMVFSNEDLSRFETPAPGNAVAEAAVSSISSLEQLPAHPSCSINSFEDNIFRSSATFMGKAGSDDPPFPPSHP